MSCPDACPACATPVDENWILLGSRCRFGVPLRTHLCPRCALGRVETSMSPKVTATPELGRQYAARLERDPMPGAWWEDDAGRVLPPTAAHIEAIEQHRILELGEALKAAEIAGSARLLHIGAGAGSFVRSAAQTYGLDATGLEPIEPWSRTAREHGTACIATELETWASSETFDVIVEHDVLQHLHDPLEHLQHVRRRLSPHGVALIEVPNLIGAAGYLEDPILRTDSPNVFAPWSLATLCHRAGLKPIAMVTEGRLRVLCKAAAPAIEVVSGPPPTEIVKAALGNEVRLSVKRLLASQGATAKVLATLTDLHRRCRHPATRADVAIEIAVGCERCSDYDAALAWLARSLEDRADPEVVAMMSRLERVRTRIQGVWQELGDPARGEASSDANPLSPC